MEIAIDNRAGLSANRLTKMRNRIQRVLEGLDCSDETELSVVITTDPDIAELNQQYLGRQGPTNVIAFPMLEGEFAELSGGLLGDVVVSLDTAQREAAENALNPERHLMRLVVHGILHLLGYDHVHDQAQARRMEQLTEQLLDSLAGSWGED